MKIFQKVSKCVKKTIEELKNLPRRLLSLFSKKKAKKIEKIQEVKKTERKIEKIPSKKTLKTKIHSSWFDVIKKPLISEKAFDLSEKNKYVFVISDSVNKTEVKKAVEAMYNVVVKNVRIIRAFSKPKRFKGVFGIKKGKRKAIITLAKGSSIDIMKEVN